MPIGVAGRHADRFAPEGLEQVRSRAFSPCDHVLGVAFRQLLANDEPLGLEELASSTGLRPGDVEAELASLAEEGRVRCDAAARVVGILGLSLEPTQHEITVGDLRRWTWCAYDAVGILAAFGQNGLIRSSSPVDASVLEIRVVAGEPLRTDVVLFIPTTAAIPSSTTGAHSSTSSRAQKRQRSGAISTA